MRRWAVARGADPSTSARPTVNDSVNIVCTFVCGEPPECHSQWSLRLLVARVVEPGYIDAVSHETVRLDKKTNQDRGVGSYG